MNNKQLPAATPASPQTEEVPIDKVRVPPQDHRKLRENRVETYLELIREGRPLPPLTVYSNGQQGGLFHLADGRHRLRAAQIAEEPTVRCRVSRGGARETICHQNANGRRKQLNVKQPTTRTEAANAARLASQYGVSIRWCDPWGKWLVWDGNRWCVDVECRVESLAKDVAEKLWT